MNLTFLLFTDENDRTLFKAAVENYSIEHIFCAFDSGLFPHTYFFSISFESVENRYLLGNLWRTEAFLISAIKTINFI